MPVIEELPVLAQRSTGPGWTYVFEPQRKRSRRQPPGADAGTGGNPSPGLYHPAVSSAGAGAALLPYTIDTGVFGTQANGISSAVQFGVSSSGVGAGIGSPMVGGSGHTFSPLTPGGAAAGGTVIDPLGSSIGLTGANAMFGSGGPFLSGPGPGAGLGGVSINASVPNSNTAVGAGGVGVVAGTPPVQTGRVRATRRQIAGGGSVALEDQRATRNLLAVTRRLAELERENPRDVQIPIPVVKSVRKQNKYNTATTTAVRRILQSQKNFTNHLNDEEALISLQQNQSLYVTNSSGGTHHTAGGGAGGTHKDGNKLTSGAGSLARRPSVTSTTLRRSDLKSPDQASSSPGATTAKQKKPKPFPLSIDVPALPSHELLEQLTSPSLSITTTASTGVTTTTTVPLSYLASRARPEDVSIVLGSQIAGIGLSGPVPPRSFCEYCGYWGKIKCIQCGCRTCSLGCKRLHDELCLRRYV